MKYVFEDMDVEVLQDKVVDDVNYDIQDNKLISKQTLCSTISSSIYNYPDGFSLYLKFDESGMQTMVSVMLAVYATQTEKCLGTFMETASVTIKRYENNFILKMEDEENSQGSLVFVTVKENGDIVKVVQNYTQLVNFEVIENKYVVVNTYEKLNEKFKIWVVGVYQLSGKPYKVFIDKKFNNTVTCITETIVVRGGRKMVYIGKIKNGKKKRTGLFDLKIKVPVSNKKNAKKNTKNGWFHRWMQARKKKKSTIEKLKQENKQKEEELEELKQKVKTQKIKLMKDNSNKDSSKESKVDSNVKETDEISGVEKNSSKDKRGKKESTKKPKKDKKSIDNQSNLEDRSNLDNSNSTDNDSKLNENKKSVKSRKKDFKEKPLEKDEQGNLNVDDSSKEDVLSNKQKDNDFIDVQDDAIELEDRDLFNEKFKVDIGDIENVEDKLDDLQDDEENNKLNAVSQEENKDKENIKVEEDLSNVTLKDKNILDELNPNAENEEETYSIKTDSNALKDKDEELDDIEVQESVKKKSDKEKLDSKIKQQLQAKQKDTEIGKNNKKSSKKLDNNKSAKKVRE